MPASEGRSGRTGWDVFGELWEDHRNWLFKCAYDSGASGRVDAEEIIQETMLRIIRAANAGAAFNTIDDLKGYFMRAVRSVTVDRARESRPVVLRDERVLEAQQDAADMVPSAEELLMNREARRTQQKQWLRLLEAIEALPRSWQTVLRLRYMDDGESCVSFSEIAEKLDKTENAVNGYHRRALRRLRVQLTGERQAEE